MSSLSFNFAAYPNKIKTYIEATDKTIDKLVLF